MEDIYNEVFDLETEESGKLLKDLGKKYAIAQQTFADFPEEDQQFLQNFSFICLLSYDVYIKKMIIESVIDQLPHENAHSSKKKPVNPARRILIRQVKSKVKDFPQQRKILFFLHSI